MLMDSMCPTYGGKKNKDDGETSKIKGKSHEIRVEGGDVSAGDDAKRVRVRQPPYPPTPERRTWKRDSSMKKARGENEPVSEVML